jgi:hypothetical protein
MDLRPSQMSWALLFLGGLMHGLAGWALAGGGAQATKNNRQALSLTIYRQGSALVEETRQVDLAGAGTLSWQDVPRTLDPSSIQLVGPRGLRVLREEFLYDPLTQKRLLKEAQGQKVFLVETVGQEGKERRTEAVLLWAEGPPVFEIGGEIHLGHPGRVVLPKMPEGLATEPEIVWAVEGVEGPAALTVRYLAGGLSWDADYVLSIDEETLQGTLTGSFSLTNSSGTDFDQARVHLVAGRPRRQVFYQKVAPLAAAAPSAERMEPAALADLYRYSLKEPVSLLDGRTLRVGFLRAEGLKLRRRYEVRPARLGPARGEERLPVHVVWLLKNSAEEGLGQPLPAGLVRVYVASARGPVLLAGEVQLDRTPVGEEVELTTGQAFDLVATRRQTSLRRLGGELYEAQWLIKIRNRKPSRERVKLIEPIPPQAELVASRPSASRPSADELHFDLEVPAEGSVEVTYRIRVPR